LVIALNGYALDATDYYGWCLLVVRLAADHLTVGGRHDFDGLLQQAVKQFAARSGMLNVSEPANTIIGVALWLKLPCNRRRIISVASRSASARSGIPLSV
jgi:hypothetical protein